MESLNCPVCGRELPITLAQVTDVNDFTCKHCDTTFALNNPHTPEVTVDPSQEPSVTQDTARNVAMNPYTRSENRDVGESERLESIEFSYQENGQAKLLIIPVRQIS
ncbi:hypothetical protein [Deinococcus cellulosilyticus]|uniref:Uncharacterized protein n=1 Tax=Deinococcus cellulosilyticus (strain DSM 18568 / NBRC 106333 / KACC 11606 / 5516J-15) TaxID=1223518 RepID=A0A511N0U8_DEIC1|nr:hypothetical protein [Deinococcus cellulosilyticus]GEM46091.1 hypothetical protein DC3_17260 [Deinococcus cellulosilyticus NBRC 106333 = KACC 11606]